MLTRSSKKSRLSPPPRVWPAGRGSVLHEPCTARSRRAPPWQAARRCDEQQGGAGGIAKCRCLCFRAAAACTPPSRGQPRLDFEVWQDDRLARPGRAGWGRLNGAKRAQSSSTCPIGLAQAANPRAASLPTRARWRLEVRPTFVLTNLFWQKSFTTAGVGVLRNPTGCPFAAFGESYTNNFTCCRRSDRRSGARNIFTSPDKFVCQVRQGCARISLTTSQTPRCAVAVDQTVDPSLGTFFTRQIC